MLRVVVIVDSIYGRLGEVWQWYTSPPFTALIVRAVQVGWINMPRLTFVAGEQRIGLEDESSKNNALI